MWRKLTTADMASSLTPAEQLVLRAAQNLNSGLATKLNVVVPEFVGAMSAAGYPVNTDGSVPDQLRRHVMAATVWAWLQDFPSLRAFKTDARKKAADDAQKIYERIVARTYGALEAPYGTDTTTGNWNSERKLILRTHPVPTPEQQFQNTADFYANPNAAPDTAAVAAVQEAIGEGQLVYYTGLDPNTDKVVPVNTQAPAIALRKGGAGNWYAWSVDNQNWS